MKLKGSKVLVTGAAGFIGSHLAEELVRQGAKTRAMVRYVSDGNCGFLDRSELRGDIEIFAGDIADRDSVRAAMAGVDIVFHLAALIAIPYSYRAPESYIHANVTGTLNVLQSARELNIGRVVQTSTSEVYGTAHYVPIDEAHPLQGQSPYSASKIGADMLADSFHRSFNVPVTVLRPFNTFGPRQSRRAVIPTIIAQCLSGRRVKLGAVSPTRDFTYVSDTVAGFLAAGMSGKAIGETINLGVGQDISIGDLAKKIGTLMQRDVVIECEQERLRPPASEVERLCSNNEKAKKILGWEPKVSLEDGLRQAIEWMRANTQRVRTGTYVV